MARGKNYMNNNRGVGLQAHTKKGSNQIPCQYGAGCTRPDCIYRHDTPTAASGGDGTGGGSVCLPYLAGLCTFTNQGCRNYHPTNHAEIQRLKAKYKKIRCRHGNACRTDGCLYLHPKEMKPMEPNYVLPQSSFPPLQQNNTNNPILPSGGGIHHRPVASGGGPWQQQQHAPPQQQPFYSQPPPPVPQASATVTSSLPVHSAWKPTLPTNPSVLQQQQRSFAQPPHVPPPSNTNPWSMQPHQQQLQQKPRMATVPPQYPLGASISQVGGGVGAVAVGGVGGSSVWGNPSVSGKPSFASVVAKSVETNNEGGGGKPTNVEQQQPTSKTNDDEATTTAMLNNSGNFNVNAKEFVPSWAM